MKLKKSVFHLLPADDFQMQIIFGEAGLRDVITPCVAQSFINHDGILHKVFIVGDTNFVVERPSIKNLQPGGITSNLNISVDLLVMR